MAIDFQAIQEAMARRQQQGGQAPQQSADAQMLQGQADAGAQVQPLEQLPPRPTAPPVDPIIKRGNDIVKGLVRHLRDITRPQGAEQQQQPQSPVSVQEAPVGL